MKGQSHPRNDTGLNPCTDTSIRSVIEAVDHHRRRIVQGGVGGAALASAGGLTLGGLVGTVQAAPVPPAPGFPGIGFESLPPSLAPVADRVTVPPGYSAELFVAWGDPIMPGGTAFSGSATETAVEQLRQ